MSNLVYSDSVKDYFVKLDGFTNTMIASISGVFEQSPPDITFDGTNYYYASGGTVTGVKKVVGFTNTIVDSIIPAVAVTGVTCDSDNWYYCQDSLDKYLKCVLFESTVDSSFTHTTRVRGITFDGTDLYGCDPSDDKIRQFDGFSSSVLDSLSSVGSFPAGVTTDGTYFYTNDRDSTGIINQRTGFVSTITSTITAPNSDVNVVGMTWDNFNERMGIAPGITFIPKATIF